MKEQQRQTGNRCFSLRTEQQVDLHSNQDDLVEFKHTDNGDSLINQPFIGIGLYSPC